VSGKTDRHVAKVDFGMQTATPMKESGCKTKQTDMDCICIQMELNTWASGKMMCSMAGVKKLGQMAQDSKVIIMRVKNMATVLTTGQMVLRLQEVGLTIK